MVTTAFDQEPDRAARTVPAPEPDLHAVLACLRAALQDMNGLLDRVRHGEVDIQSLVPSIMPLAGRIGALDKRLDGLTADAITALLANDGQHDVAALRETIFHIHDFIEQLLHCPLLQTPDGTTITAEKQLHWLNQAEDLYCKLLYRIGLYTIPLQINSWLAQEYPGYVVPFHKAFEKDLPLAADRQQLLSQLMLTPKAIKGGIVDPGAGIIYRYSASWLKQGLTALAVVGAYVGVGAGLAAVQQDNATAYFGASGGALLPGQGTTPLVLLWVMILAGVMFHVVISTAKRMQSQPDNPPIFAMGTIFPMISAKIGRILFKLVMTLVALFGLVFSLGSGSGDLTLLNALLAGYSLDSVVELFGTSMESQASAQLKTLSQQAGGTVVA
ncbi:MAG: hypothetical protein NVS2B7_16300 [Herpetosiphon sp.]